jgi:LDH2 family malate/lactate/ureidoglycolate dehydrogenase
MVVDILCGVLAGARASPAIWPAYERGEPADVGHMVAAIDLAAFGSVDEFKRSMDLYIDMLHSAPRATDVDRILVAGELEFETEEQRLRGVPLHPRVAESLHALGLELGLTPPL